MREGAGYRDLAAPFVVTGAPEERAGDGGCPAEDIDPVDIGAGLPDVEVGSGSEVRIGDRKRHPAN